MLLQGSKRLRMEMDPLVRVAKFHLQCQSREVSCANLCRVVRTYLPRETDAIAIVEQSLPGCKCTPHQPEATEASVALEPTEVPMGT